MHAKNPNLFYAFLIPQYNEEVVNIIQTIFNLHQQL